MCKLMQYFLWNKDGGQKAASTKILSELYIFLTLDKDRDSLQYLIQQMN